MHFAKAHTRKKLKETYETNEEVSKEYSQKIFFFCFFYILIKRVRAGFFETIITVGYFFHCVKIFFLIYESYLNLDLFLIFNFEDCQISNREKISVIQRVLIYSVIC